MWKTFVPIYSHNYHRFHFTRYVRSPASSTSTIFKLRTLSTGDETRPYESNSSSGAAPSSSKNESIESIGGQNQSPSPRAGTPTEQTEVAAIESWRNFIMDSAKLARASFNREFATLQRLHPPPRFKQTRLYGPALVARLVQSGARRFSVLSSPPRMPVQVKRKSLILRE